MSEVIENYIRRHPTLSEKDAFDGFLQEERIKAWIAGDESRKERLRREFGRVWSGMQSDGPSTATSGSGGRVGPSGPSSPVRAAHVEVQPRPEERPAAPRSPPGPVMTRVHSSSQPTGGRRLQVMCPQCMRTQVWVNDDNSIACRRCGRDFDDLLQLIRVTPVGPFAFVFGEGWRGLATAAGIAAAVLALYGVLRWV